MEKKVYEKETFGWLREQAKKDGFDNIKNWQKYRINQQEIDKYRKNTKNIDQVEKILEENKIKIKYGLIFYIFWNKVDIKDNTEECWLWTEYLQYEYGIYYYNKKRMLSHRFAYIHTIGSIPDKVEVQHLCNNGRCCNPYHLELGNNLKNMQYKVICDRQTKGENANSKLIDDHVRKIHELYKEGKSKHSRQQVVEPIAKKFGITRRQVCNIVHGRQWKHIYKEFHPEEK